MLQKAQTASEKNIEASALEKIQVEVAGSYGLDGKIDNTQLVNNLKKIQGIKYNNSDIDVNTSISSFPATVKLDGYSYVISENGSVDRAVWIDNNNGSYTNAETGQILTVGDTVKYETVLNKSENTVDNMKLSQLKTDLQDYSGDSSSTDNANIARDNLAWKFLDIKDGQIRLISSAPTNKKIKLYSYNGYNNAVYLIDEACDILYSSNKGKSKNLKIEDIEEKINKTQYDYTQFENSNVDTGKYGGTKEYTSNLQYPNIYKSEVGCKAIATVDNTGNILEPSNQLSLVAGNSIASGRLKISQTYWGDSISKSFFKDFKNSQSQYYTLFINNGSNYPTYFLSSRSVNCWDNAAGFGVRAFENGSLRQYTMFDSYGQSYNNSYVFRPVVTLNSDVQLEPDETTANTWNIK